jgi:hypothetical protein
MSNIIICNGTIHEILLASSNQGGLNQDMEDALANKNIYKFWLENPKGRNYFGYFESRIILNHIFKNIFKPCFVRGLPQCK